MSKENLQFESESSLVKIASIINLIEEKHEEFESFSIHFTKNTLQDLKDFFRKFSRVLPEKVYQNIQDKATESMNSELVKCEKFIQRCKFDVDMIFGDDVMLWNQNGFNEYDNANKSGKNMSLFLSDLELIANLYKHQLMEIGWTDESFAKMTEYQENLKKCIDEQNVSIINRNRAAAKRTQYLNGLYEKLDMYKRAAFILFDGKADLLEWFKFLNEIELEKEERLPAEVN